MQYINDILVDTKIDHLAFISDPLYFDGMKKLFSLLNSKDMFCKIYKSCLAERLLSGLTFNKDNEIAFIVFIRDTFDSSVTKQYQKMIFDVEDSTSKYSDITDISGITYSPLILTNGVWPFSKTENFIIKLPEQLEGVSSSFLTEYSNTNDKKQVCWIPLKSLVTLEFKTARTYIIDMNHYQATVMLLCMTHTTVKKDFLLGEINIRENWLDAVLDSLLLTRLIEYNPKLDMYRINPKFSAKSLKLNATVRFKRPIDEGDDDIITKEVDEERSLKTQAAIVRIMKARRVCSKSELINSVVTQTSRYFQQTSERILKQIQVLLSSTEDRYMEIVDNSTYRYVTGITN